MDFVKKLNRGFSLIELTIILIIVGILALGVYLQWSGGTINLEAEAQQIASDIRYTQSLSMTKGERFALARTSSTSYQIINSAGTAILLAQGNTTANLKSGISFGTFVNLPNNLICFDGKGIPYTNTGSGATALASTATIPVISGSETRNILIAPETGRVTIQ